MLYEEYCVITDVVTLTYSLKPRPHGHHVVVQTAMLWLNGDNLDISCPDVVNLTREI